MRSELKKGNMDKYLERIVKEMKQHKDKIKETNINDNDMGAIDRKINESYEDTIKGMKDSLKHKSISTEDMQDSIKDMLINFSKEELEKVFKVVLDIEEKNIETK